MPGTVFWVYIHYLDEFSPQPHEAGSILYMTKLGLREMRSLCRITQLLCGLAGTATQVCLIFKLALLTRTGYSVPSSWTFPFVLFENALLTQGGAWNFLHLHKKIGKGISAYFLLLSLTEIGLVLQRKNRVKWNSVLNLGFLWVHVTSLQISL